MTPRAPGAAFRALFFLASLLTLWSAWKFGELIRKSRAVTEVHAVQKRGRVEAVVNGVPRGYGPQPVGVTTLKVDQRYPARPPGDISAGEWLGSASLFALAALALQLLALRRFPGLKTPG